MIVRVWKARATPQNASVYREHLETLVFPMLRSVRGFLGADVMQRREGEEIELVVSSRWTDLEAVRQFAGDALENAVVVPAARAVLSSYDALVAHYEVTAECRA
jgi:heme-degrading monooxygenase HmoA